MPLTTIRKYKKEDRDALIRCLTCLQDIRAELDENKLLRSTKELAIAIADSLEETINTGNGGTFVVAHGKDIHGCGSYRADNFMGISKLEHTVDKIGVIHKVYLDEHLRGKGYGNKVFKKLEGELMKLGCKYVTLDVSIHNVSAHSLYKRLGYNDRSRKMIKEL